MAEAIVENSKVRLVTAVGVVLFFVGAAVKVSIWMREDALWKLGQEHNMEKVQAVLEGKAGDRWKRKDMRKWAHALRDQNAAVKVPDVPEGDE